MCNKTLPSTPVVVHRWHDAVSLNPRHLDDLNEFMPMLFCDDACMLRYKDVFLRLKFTFAMRQQIHAFRVPRPEES